MSYLESASNSALESLRSLAAEQYGNLLIAQVKRYGGRGDAYGDGDPAGGSSLTEAACTHLVRMIADPNTGVAAVAAKALGMYGRSSLEALQQMLSPGSAPGALLLAAAAGESGSVVQLRVLELALDLSIDGGFTKRYGIRTV